MSAISRRLRFAALLSAGAVAVHELRYVVGPNSGDVAGHGYLQLLFPLVALAVVLALVNFGALLLCARRGKATPSAGSPPSLLATWALAAGCLFFVFVVQEGLEAWLTTACCREAPVEMLLGGGWSALPISIAVGLVLALLLRGAAAAVTRAAGAAPPAARLRPIASPLRPRALPAPRLALVARHLVGRGPPLTSV